MKRTYFLGGIQWTFLFLHSLDNDLDLWELPGAPRILLFTLRSLTSSQSRAKSCRAPTTSDHPSTRSSSIPSLPSRSIGLCRWMPGSLGIQERPSSGRLRELQLGWPKRDNSMKMAPLKKKKKKMAPLKKRFPLKMLIFKSFGMMAPLKRKKRFPLEE